MPIMLNTQSVTAPPPPRTLSEGPTLFFDQGKVLVADLSELTAPSRETVTTILEAERNGADGGSVMAMPLGAALRRHFLQLLEGAIKSGDFTRQTEFWDVFDLVMALGVKGTDLAVVLECRPEMISRYRNRKNAPPTSVVRRAVLAEALKMAKADADALAKAA